MTGIGTTVGLFTVAFWLWQKDSNALALLCAVLGGLSLVTGLL